MNNYLVVCNFHSGLGIRRGYRQCTERSEKNSNGEGEDMKKLLITGIALCFMGFAVPSFAAPQQDQTQQDQMKKTTA